MNPQAVNQQAALNRQAASLLKIIFNFCYSKINKRKVNTGLHCENLVKFRILYTVYTV